MGFLEKGFQSWIDSGFETDSINSITASELVDVINENGIVFDVRKPGEYETEHIENVPSTPLDFLNNHLIDFPKDETFFIHCAGGYRSVIAASILKSRGIHNVVDIKGGYAAIKNTSVKRTESLCSSQK